MASTTKDTVWSREQIVEELKALRKSKNYKLSVNLLVKKNYDREEAKAILIYLATTSLDEADQIIVLGAWQLLPGYQNIKRLQDRRIKVKEAIQYKGAPESLDNRENKAFGVIVDSFFDDFSNPERWEIIAQAALKEHYDSEKKEAILPKLSCAVAAESVASTEDTAEKHQTTPTKPNITLKQESKKTVERTAPENDPAESQSSPESSSLEEGADDTSLQPQEAMRPVEEAAVKHPKLRQALLCMVLISSGIFLVFLAYLIPGGFAEVREDVTNPRFSLDLYSRNGPLATWSEDGCFASFGDKVDIQCKFRFERGLLATAMWDLSQLLGISLDIKQPTVKIMLPDNFEYVEGSATLNEYDFWGHRESYKIDQVVSTEEGLVVYLYGVDDVADIEISCIISKDDIEQISGSFVVYAEATVWNVTKQSDGVQIQMLWQNDG